jgi:nucleoside-diphosphate-sugar epimerase
MTGHNGYLGSVMAVYLQERGFSVTGLDTGFYRLCQFGDDDSYFPVIGKDIRDVAESDLRGFDAVIHLAALCNDPLGNLDPELTAEINYRASVRLATLARSAGVHRFLFASSCSMYGASSQEDLLDETAPLRPITAYAESKVHTEEEVAKLADDRFSPIFLRNGTVYGLSPRLRADVVLNNLVCHAFTSGKVRLMSDGTAWRPIVHVQDVACAFYAALVADRSRIHNEAFNVGANSENYQVRDIAEIVHKVVPNCVVEFTGEGGSDPRSYRVDFSKIGGALPAYQPRWNAWLGAEELLGGFHRFGLTTGDFQGRRFTRLAQLKFLLDHGFVDLSLRWNTGARYVAQAA